MGRLDERLIRGPVRQAIDALRERLATIGPATIEAAATQGFEGVVERASSLCDYLDGLLDSADPELVTDGMLQGIEHQLNQAAIAAESLPANIAFAQQLDQAIENVLTYTPGLAVVSRLPPDAAKGLNRRLGVAIKNTVGELEARIGDVANSVSELETVAVTQAAETEKSFEERRVALQQTLDALQAAITTEQQRLDGLVPGFEQRFTGDQVARAAEWSELRSTLEATVTETRENMRETTEQLTSSAKETLDEIASQSQTLLEEVTGRRDDVERLYGVIADEGTKGAFAQDAKEQKAAADAWRGYTVWSGIATVVLALGAVIFTAAAKNVTLVAHVGSYLVAISVGGLTAYCARQSGHHRDRELESKRFEMELAAFGPFTEALSNPDAVRTEFAERMFKGADRPQRDDKTIGKDQVNLLQTLIEALLKMGK